MEEDGGEGQGELPARLLEILKNLGVDELDVPLETLSPEKAFEMLPSLCKVVKMAEDGGFKITFPVIGTEAKLLLILNYANGKLIGIADPAKNGKIVLASDPAFKRIWSDTIRKLVAQVTGTDEAEGRLQLKHLAIIDVSPGRHDKGTGAGPRPLMLEAEIAADAT